MIANGSGELRGDVGRRIARVREEKGWTQQQCAARVGITVRRLRRVEAGSNGTLRTLERIAVALDVPAGSLLEPLQARSAARRGRPRRLPPREVGGEYVVACSRSALPLEVLLVLDAARAVVAAGPTTTAHHELIAALAAFDRTSAEQRESSRDCAASARAP